MIFYILNAALILAGCLIFYKILLQKETFFPLNRFVLLGCLALSFSLPLVPVPAQWSFRKAAVQQEVYQALPVRDTRQLPVAAPQKPAEIRKAASASPGLFSNISTVNFIIWAYWIGVVIFAVNFLVQFIMLIYQAYSRPVIIDGKFRIVELSGDKAPCSFGNNIFINPEKYEWETYSQILLHEKIHIEQGHSFDILFAELALVFQWFNPFAWFYRKAVEDNLEFLTDNELLQHNNVERESYQMSLVKVSAPHFPVSLTTNYNQSILKKRLIMMNAKKSNIHTTWKYLFIIPLMVAFVCFLNEPVAFGKKAGTEATNGYEFTTDFQHEGVWFATIKGNKVHIQFKNDEEDDHNNSSTTFDLAEFKDLPQDKTGNFSLTRDAGTMTFTGKFEDNMGMGKYAFTEDKGFLEFLKNEDLDMNRENDPIAFYLLNVKKSYVKMLKAEGFRNFSGGDLIALTALNVDQDFIKMLKNNGYANISLKQLVPLKAVGVDEKYIKEIKAAGYENASTDQLLTFRAQKFSGDFLKSSRDAARAERNENKDKSWKEDKKDKGWKGDKGARDESAENDEDDAFGNMIASKVLGITADFLKSFADIGLKVSTEEAQGLKAMNVTPEYIQAIKTQGFPNVSTDEVMGLKALGIDGNKIKAYQALGFKEVTLDDVISATATGTTPAYISAMKKKGYNYQSIDKYVSAKTLSLIGIE